jgi:Fic family protein
MPEALKDRVLALDPPTATRAGAASAAIVYAAESMGSDLEELARLLLRSEGVASSYVEGVLAPVVDIVLAEEHLAGQVEGAATWVASNLKAIDEALASAKDDVRLSIEMLCRWHQTLMKGSPAPAHHVGRVREEQGWIGGTSPLDAHLVTPPPEALPELIEDLVAYANRTDLDPIAQAGIAHAQFELIHPFADGNGRIGRILAAWLLTRRLSLVVPPPLSIAVAADVGGYSSGLVLFRMGDHNSWVRWFCDAVIAGGRAQQALASNVEHIRSAWRARFEGSGRRVRSDATALRALDLLPRRVVLTSRIISEELSVSRKTAIATLQRLADMGVLKEYGSVNNSGRGPHSRLFVSVELLGLAGSSPLGEVSRGREQSN